MLSVRQGVHQYPDYYRKRPRINGHMFETMKRQRGFTFTLVRGKNNVLGEVGLMFIGYNLSRCVSVLGAEKLIKALKERCSSDLLLVLWIILSHFKLLFEKCTSFQKSCSEKFYLFKSSLLCIYELSLILK